MNDSERNEAKKQIVLENVLFSVFITPPQIIE
jgi:hypothetical protein